MDSARVSPEWAQVRVPEWAQVRVPEWAQVRVPEWEQVRVPEWEQDRWECSGCPERQQQEVVLRYWAAVVWVAGRWWEVRPRGFQGDFLPDRG